MIKIRNYIFTLGCILLLFIIYYPLSIPILMTTGIHMGFVCLLSIFCFLITIVLTTNYYANYKKMNVSILLISILGAFISMLGILISFFIGFP